jgi:putative transposase
MRKGAYPSDVTDSEWEMIKPLLPEEKRRGRKRETDLREVINAIFYLLEAGCQWRSLPHDFPHWSTVRTSFDQWKRKKVWHQLNKVLREKLRIEEGRDRQPSAASIDSQSVIVLPPAGGGSCDDFVKTTEKRGKYTDLTGEKSHRQKASYIGRSFRVIARSHRNRG